MHIARETPKAIPSAVLYNNSHICIIYGFIRMLDVSERTNEMNGDSRNAFSHNDNRIQNDGP